MAIIPIRPQDEPVRAIPAAEGTMPMVPAAGRRSASRRTFGKGHPSR